MRLTTLFSIAVLSVSSAALAQVASTPVEQKVGDANGSAGNDMLLTDNSMAGQDAGMANDTSVPMSNDTAGPDDMPDPMSNTTR